MLSFASAQNDTAGSSRAMESALASVRHQLGADPDLIIVFASIGHDFAEVLAAAKRLAPEARLVGSSCAGVIGIDGASERMRTLALMGVRGANEIGVGLADGIDGDNAYDKAVEAARALEASGAPPRFVQVFVPGLDIAADQVVRGIESVLGDQVTIFGGTAADNMRARATYQFHGERVHERAIALVGFSDPSLEFVAGVHHGSLPVSRDLVVTRAKGHRLYELDGKPAWHLLMDELGMPRTTPAGEALVVSSLGQSMPDRLRDAYGNEHFIHTIFRVDDDGTCWLPAQIDEGTSLRLMQRDEASIFAGADLIASRMQKALHGRRPVAVFHADCGARGRATFNKVLKDEIIERLQYPLTGGEAVPWLGIYGFGEFAPVEGTNRFHTQTSSICALVRPD